MVIQDLGFSIYIYDLMRSWASPLQKGSMADKLGFWA